MKFTAPASELARAAGLAKKHADVVQLEPGDALVLACREGPIALRLALAGVPASGARTVLSADDLARIAKSLGGTITMCPSDECTRLVFTAGKRRAEASLINADDVIAVGVPALEGTPRTMRAAALREAIVRVRAAASDDADRPSICGVLLELAPEKLLSVALNGHWAIAAGDITAAYPETLHLPGALVAVLLDLLPAEGDVTLAHAPGRIVVTGNGWLVAFSAIEAQFPPWRQLVPAARVLAITADRDVFIGEVSAVFGAVVGVEKNCMRVTIRDGAVTLRCASELSDARGMLEARVMPSDSAAVFGINGAYLLAALRSMPAGDVVFSMSGGELEPLVLEPADASSVAIIMPVRV